MELFLLFPVTMATILTMMDVHLTAQYKRITVAVEDLQPVEVLVCTAILCLSDCQG
jgi:hypothetical protein